MELGAVENSKRRVLPRVNLLLGKYQRHTVRVVEGKERLGSV